MIDPRTIRMLTPDEQATQREALAEREAAQRAAVLADLARFDPLRRAPAGRPKKMPPAHIAPLLWADACRVQRGDEGWGWETVRRKYREVYPISVRWLKRVVQDGSLERMAAGM